MLINGYILSQSRNSIKNQNLFRSLKRILSLETIISHDLNGVTNWVLLHIIFILLLTLYALLTGGPTILVNFKDLIRNWRQAIHKNLISRGKASTFFS